MKLSRWAAKAYLFVLIEAIFSGLFYAAAGGGRHGLEAIVVVHGVFLAFELACYCLDHLERTRGKSE